MNFTDLLDNYLDAKKELTEAKEKCNGYFDGYWREYGNYQKAKEAFDSFFAELQNKQTK